LCENPRWALTTWQQAIGFMFQRPRGCLVFLFKPARRDMIHMWFVFGSIDALILDGNGEVIALRENLKPWWMWNPKVKISALIELPAGTISATGTRLGDRIELPSLR
jgi:uncharacterized protein